MIKQALIFGATGAVGRQLLDSCLNGNYYQQVTVIARRAAPVTHKKLNWIICEFSELNNLPMLNDLAGGDSYCCLGTTIKAVGSKEAFRQVDYDGVVAAAKVAKQAGVKNFSLVSAIGANANSNSFYSRIKGEVEAALIEEQFSNLRIFRPSLLKGYRDEFRLKEEVANWLSLLMTPVFYLGLKKYQPIDIDKLARALYTITNNPPCTEGVSIYESDELQTY
jgi:uncharacterized protein YbjT (DUF2867 family)